MSLLCLCIFIIYKKKILCVNVKSKTHILMYAVSSMIIFVLKKITRDWSIREKFEHHVNSAYAQFPVQWTHGEKRKLYPADESHWECRKSTLANTADLHRPLQLTSCYDVHPSSSGVWTFQLISGDLPLTNSQKLMSHNPSKIHSYKQTSRTISSQSTILIVVFYVCLSHLTCVTLCDYFYESLMVFTF